jgi:nucleobase:cation symporter-1, NCS1 family
VRDELYSMSERGRYWYRAGVNWRAVGALLPAAAIAIACVLTPSLEPLANFSWFIGVALAGLFYWLVMRNARA